MAWLDQLERKYRRYGIRNLMNYIVGGMGIVFILDLLLPVQLSGMLTLQMNLVAKGELWRLVTFIFIPPSASIFWILFSLYFYWMIGNALETQWGAFRFTFFYLVGMLGNILAALLTGYAQNTHLNLSLFLAFAALWPNFEVNLFMFLPVKMKYLALLNLLLYGWFFISGGWSTRLTILFSLANVLLFIGGDFFRHIKQDSKYWKTRRNFRKQMRDANKR